jgi:hypothetical protein
MKTIILTLLLAPSIAFAQAYEGYKGYQGYQGYQGIQAPSVIVAPRSPALDSLWAEQARNAAMDTRLKREDVINQRLGSNADNYVARSIVGSIVDSEVRARDER